MELTRPRAPVDLDGPRTAGAAMLAAAATRPWWSSATGIAGLPCPLRALTGIPCPLCGMTTGVCATVSGDLPAAVAANPLGVVAVAVAVVLLVRPGWRRANVPARAVPAALGLSWCWQLIRLATAT